MRLGAVVALASLVFLANSVAQERRVDDSLALVAQSQRDANVERLATVLVLRGQVLQNFVADYSLWNDMGTFVGTRDPEWAKVNVDASLVTFKLDHVWIFDPGGRLAYHASTTEPLPELPGTGAPPPALFRDGPFVHYFARLADGAFLEIRGAFIQREDDAARRSEARGYFFAARRWGDAYVGELDSLTGAAVTVRGADETCDAPSGETTVVVSRELPGPDGDGVGRVCAVSSSPVAGIIGNFHSQTRSASIVFAVLLVVLLSLSLHVLVNRPLSVISDALSRGSSSGLAELRRRYDEIGELAEVTHQYQRSMEERDALRAKVYQSSKLASLSVLGTGLAHELNNPLATVLARADMLLDVSSHGEVEPEEARDAARVIVEQAQRMRQIIDHVRALNPHERAAEEPVALSAVLAECRTFLEAKLLADDVRLEVGPAVDAAVRCDRAKLSTIARNLVDNAADALAAAPSGGEKRVCIEADVDLEHQRGILRVHDTGPGVPEEIRDRIFEPFFTTKPVGKGTGLGLWMVHGMVTECGGAVSFETSSLGTTFEVWLPLAAQEVRHGP